MIAGAQLNIGHTMYNVHVHVTLSVVIQGKKHLDGQLSPILFPPNCAPGHSIRRIQCTITQKVANNQGSFFR